MREAWVLLCSVFLVALFGLPGTSEAGMPAAPPTLVFREPHQGSTSHFVDLPPKVGRGKRAAFSPGDELIFTDRLEQRRKIVGKIHVVCTATRKGADGVDAGFICDILAKVPGGTLAMTSPYAERGNPNGREGAVVGGTGRYAGATGVFDDEEGRRFDTLTITLAGSAAASSIRRTSQNGRACGSGPRWAVGGRRTRSERRLSAGISRRGSWPCGSRAG